MPKLENQDELDAYYLADPTQPRAAGVMWPAIIERRIDKLFATGFRPDKTVHNELFQQSGALGSYAVKVRLVYLLGWIEKDLYSDLILISKIRNRFAHNIEAKDFSDRRIDELLKKMHAYQILPPMLKSAKKRVEKESTTVNRVSVRILEEALNDGMKALRLCVDMMIHQLEKCQSNMERNLADLPGNWLVTDPIPKGSDANSRS